ncbi:cbb3-type cytochrome c oxidase subunit 3 [Alsobacter sp. SYSU M60028]|uniref:Cbb3-type cytochrome c oxidase subunit 3 n=1 Tax=Alsobacter ponti TaxID=2962936 RepID=A0ABT1L911_9HYPH|nr:cbb3-type cytochrome c oxidase subunit 3 [Alsobacter ponti]MCP8937433.1 cbb3-type cytochrome c oxidase subunit 3 [Alsobacter ponti]
MTHDFALWLSKSVGLFWLIGMSLGVLAYTFWPSNQKRFRDAANSVIEDEDKPWR